MVALAKGTRHLVKTKAARSKIQSLSKSGQPVSLELGAGNKKGTGGWTTLDLVPGCDIYCDLAKGIPFPDRSIQNMYSSHFFEHLTFKESQILLDECMRVMRPGGKFSVCVPNARLYVKAYLEDQVLDDKTFFGYKPGYNHTSKIDYINYVAYLDGHHKYMFDEENLITILGKKGFKNARIRQFDKTLDMIERDFESIYAEAER